MKIQLDQKNNPKNQRLKVMARKKKVSASTSRLS